MGSGTVSADVGGDSGCACSTAPRPLSTGGFALLVALLGLKAPPAARLTDHGERHRTRTNPPNKSKRRDTR
jgi:MYXO-CTERM domain-containing protein